MKQQLCSGCGKKVSRKLNMCPFCNPVVAAKPASSLPFRDLIERMDNAAVKAEYQRATHDLAGFIQGHYQEIEKRYEAYPKLVEEMQGQLDFARAQGNRENVAVIEALLRELGEET